MDKQQMLKRNINCFAKENMIWVLENNAIVAVHYYFTVNNEFVNEV